MELHSGVPTHDLLLLCKRWVEDISSHPNNWVGDHEGDMIRLVRTIFPDVKCRWLEDPAYDGWVDTTAPDSKYFARGEGWHVVALPRAAGKTTNMLRWLREAPEGEIRVLVSRSSQEAMRVYRSTMVDAIDRMYSEFESWQFIGIDELRPGPGPLFSAVPGRNRIVLGVDDLDFILARVMSSPWPIRAISFSTGAV